jgi:hypothetical protein
MDASTLEVADSFQTVVRFSLMSNWLVTNPSY